jgi:hypothetical protein
MVFAAQLKETLGKAWVILSLSAFMFVFPVGSSEAADDQGSVNYLEAFKRKILDASIDSGVSVASLSYVDGSGSLENHTVFSSKATVRGMQVSSYLTSIRGEFQPRIDDVALDEASWCDILASEGLHAPGLLSLEVYTDPGRESAAGLVLSKLVSDLVSQVKKSAQEEDFGFAGASKFQGFETSSSQYQAYLLGDWGVVPSPDFLMRVHLGIRQSPSRTNPLFFNHPATASVMGAFKKSSSSFDLAIKVELTQPSANRDLDSLEFTIPVTVSRNPGSGELVFSENLNSLNLAFQVMMQNLNEQAVCLPKTFNVSKVDSGTFKIDAGLMRGIRSGDWLLVGDRGLLIDSIVSDKTIESLFVLKVTDIRDSSATATLVTSYAAGKESDDLSYVGLAIGERLHR